jgi:CheY-like chemotaxis protein
MNSRPVTVLLVDDDRVDAMAVRRAFRALNITNPLVEAHNGIEALERLRGEDGRPPLPPSVLVLLDLNMPRMGGIEFLDELRGDAGLRDTIVFVMTTSAAEADRKQAYARNVAGYLVKQEPGRMFLESMAMLQHYCQVVEFPN